MKRECCIVDCEAWETKSKTGSGLPGCAAHRAMMAFGAEFRAWEQGIGYFTVFIPSEKRKSEVG
jgi:hypothetical protein